MSRRVVLAAIGIAVAAGLWWGATAWQDRVPETVPPPVPAESDAQSDPEIEKVLVLAGGAKVIYRERSMAETALYVRTGQENLVSDDMPSPPAVSPNKKRIAYIAPLGWELIGEVFIYDTAGGRVRKVLAAKGLPSQTTPMALAWLDDRYLLVVIGVAYGAIGVGGDLYALDTSTGKLTMVIDCPDETRGVKEIGVSGDALQMQISVYEQDKDSNIETLQASVSLARLRQAVKQRVVLPLSRIKGSKE